MPTYDGPATGTEFSTFEQFAFDRLIKMGSSSTRADARADMCQKCIEIEDRIKSLRRLSFLVGDQRAADGIEKEISKLEAQKIALHPKPSEAL